MFTFWKLSKRRMHIYMVEVYRISLRSLLAIILVHVIVALFYEKVTNEYLSPPGYLPGDDVVVCA